MVGGISHEMAAAGLNIATMTNKSRGEIWPTPWSTWTATYRTSVIKAIAAIDGVLMVRYLPAGRLKGVRSRRGAASVDGWTAS